MMKNKIFLLTAMVLGTAALVWAGGDNKLALNGYCPVAYHAEGKAVKGKAEFASEYQGQTFYFADANAKKMFDKNPQKYLPAYNGFCTAALAGGHKMDSDPNVFLIYEGQTYLFSSKDAKKMFEKDPKGTIAKANTQWEQFKAKK